MLPPVVDRLASGALTAGDRRVLLQYAAIAGVRPPDFGPVPEGDELQFLRTGRPDERAGPHAAWR
jgi:hypothetical protein